MLKRFLKTTKGKVTAICSGVALVAVVAAVAVMLILNNNKYRSISVADVKGIVNVIGQKNNGQAYKVQRLFDGDDVSVMEDSELTLCLNNDKYVYADENTHFKLEAASSKQGNKLKIVLDKGSELNVLTAKLGDGDTYQVDTPNSTMSVRGTRFRMTVYIGDDGYTYTLLEVESGIVLAQLKTLTGDYNGVEKEFFAGQSALIRGGDDFSEFVLSEDNAEVWLLDYKSLPSEAVPRLVELLKKNEETEKAAKEAEEKAIAEAEEKEKNQAVEKDTDKDTDADKDKDKDTDADKDKDADKDSKDKDAKEKDSKDGKDAKDSKDTKDNKDNKDNKDTAKDNKDANNQANNDSGNNNNNNQANNDSGNNNNQQQTTHTHTWTEVIDKQPICGEEGSKHLECSCGEKQAAVSIPATGNHTWTEVIDKDATCAATGIKHEECSVCHAKQNENTVIAATGKHSFGDWSYKSAKDEPDCTNGGTHTHTCKVCGVEESEPVSALGHDYTKWVTVTAPTCGSDGLEECTCSRCGQSNKNTRAVPATGNHSWHKTGNKENFQEYIDPDTGTFTGSSWDYEYACDNCPATKWEKEYD